MLEDTLRVVDVSKSYPGTLALSHVSLGVRGGEVHTLVGQNGSGKSTLVKILAGYHTPDSGEILIDGTTTGRKLRSDDRLRFVHQELGLVTQMSATDNLGLQSQFIVGRSRRIQWRRQEALTEQLLARFDLRLDLSRPLTEATPCERALVAIVAALVGFEAGNGILVLDEPTALLPPHETSRLLSIIRELRSTGIGILYISHRIDEVFAIADRVSVLRDGRLVATEDIGGLTEQALIQLMVGRELEGLAAEDESPANGRIVVDELRFRHRGIWKDVSLAIREGEVVGVAGLAGSGREELPYALASGQLRSQDSLGKDRRLIVAFVPADRADEGVIRQMSLTENLTLSSLEGNRSWGIIKRRREERVVEEWLSKLAIVTSGPRAVISSLSGGNQQKVLLARCLQQKPQLLVMAEPTAGVDVAARRMIYEIVLSSAREGLAVVVASSDIGDLVALCSRVLVFSDGKITQVLKGSEVSEDNILRAMEGVREAECLQS
jgi:ABC-type sugar transport system ATPase subunit